QRSMDVDRAKRRNIQRCLRQDLPKSSDNIDIWLPFFKFGEGFSAAQFFRLEDRDSCFQCYPFDRRWLDLLVSSSGTIRLGDNADNLVMLDKLAQDRNRKIRCSHKYDF